MIRGSKTGYRPPLTTSREALLVNGSDDGFRALVDSLVAFAGKLQLIRETIARQMDLTPPQYNILMALAHLGRPGMTISEMAQQLRVSVPFIVTETRRLDDKGLLRKQSDEEDRRRVNLVLTEKGLAALEAISPLQRDVNDVLFSSLDQGDFEALGKLTRGLLGSCESGLATARAPRPRPSKQKTRHIASAPR
jgi:DNA-binding MarR family transcriptional regulator